MRPDNSEYHAVQIAASDRPEKTTTKQMIGHFEKAGVNPKRIMKEFPVTPDAHVPVGMFNPRSTSTDYMSNPVFEGTTLSAIHFVPGQYVDVIAKSYAKFVLMSATSVNI